MAFSRRTHTYTAQVLTVRAAFTTRAADEAQDEADAIRPPMFAAAEERLEWQRVEDIAKAERQRASYLADAAADALLKAAGCRVPRDRFRRR